MKYDVIIIGAGLGGLTAGAKLALSGKRVLLLEQHDRPGGCATTFKRRDFTMEVGLHEMDGLHSGDIKQRIFRELGIFDRVEFLEVPEFYRFMNERYDLVIPHDPQQAGQVLKQAFPGEEKGIEDYFFHVLNARKIMVRYKNQPDRSIGEFLDSIHDLKVQGTHFRIAVLVNGRHYTHLAEGLATTLADGDEIAIFPPMAGG